MRDRPRGRLSSSIARLLAPVLSAGLAGCSMLSYRVPLAITSGDPSAFSRTRRVCVYAFDTGSPADVAGAIRAELEMRLGPLEPCGAGNDEIVVQYSSGPAACVDCGGTRAGPRFASARVQVRNDVSIFAAGDWVWTKGGDAVEVARSFGRALAQRMGAAAGGRGATGPPPARRGSDR